MNAPLGSFGDVAVQSFHETKNIQCGEGGAIVINDQNLENLASVLRDKGTDRKLFDQGDVQKYQWIGKGSSYILSEILAGYLEGQLLNFEKIQSDRKRIWEYYSSNLASWAKNEFIELLIYLQFNSQLCSAN
jgi:dTDP-4-amino-4,6-dideoxygalactose transaminase